MNNVKIICLWNTRAIKYLEKLRIWEIICKELYIKQIKKIGYVSWLNNRTMESIWNTCICFSDVYKINSIWHSFSVIIKIHVLFYRIYDHKGSNSWDVAEIK